MKCELELSSGLPLDSPSHSGDPGGHAVRSNQPAEPAEPQPLSALGPGVAAEPMVLLPPRPGRDYDRGVPASGRGTGPPSQELRFCQSADGVTHRLRGARQGPAGDRDLLAESPATRLAEPGVAALLGGPGPDRDGDPVRRAGYGLSDWEVNDFALEARFPSRGGRRDMRTGHFALMAMSQGGPPPSPTSPATPSA